MDRAIRDAIVRVVRDAGARLFGQASAPPFRTAPLAWLRETVVDAVIALAVSLPILIVTTVLFALLSRWLGD